MMYFFQRLFQVQLPVHRTASLKFPEMVLSSSLKTKRSDFFKTERSAFEQT
jgi:hypothetical protein